MKKILTGNKAIALFMGYKFDKYNNLFSKKNPKITICGIKDLQYHKDWNIIIPVIERFEKLQFTAYKKMTVPNTHSAKLSLMQPMHNNYDILKTFSNVVEGIDWFLYHKEFNSEFCNQKTTIK